MRTELYSALVRAPSKIGGGAGWLAGVVASVWPHAVESWTGEMIDSSTIQELGIFLLAFSSLYFAALWLLKPTALDESSARRIARRESLIKSARRKLVTYEGESLNGFLPWFESQEEYFELCPHLDHRGLNEALDKSQTVIVKHHGVVDVGKAFIASEIDRLAREWKVD